MSQDTQAAIARMSDFVYDRQNWRDELNNAIKPYLAKWAKRMREAAKTSHELGQALPEMLEIEDYDTLLTAVGNAYKIGGAVAKTFTEETSRILYFVYRLTFEFPADVAQTERDRLIEQFGLVSKLTGKVNPGTLKRMNASAHRPLCVAESIMLGQCPVKIDETLASFAKRVLKDGYTYVDAGQTVPFSEDDIMSWVKRRWDVILSEKANTVPKLVKVFEKDHDKTATVHQTRKENRSQAKIDKQVSEFVSGKVNWNGMTLDAQSDLTNQFQKRGMPIIDDISVRILTLALLPQAEPEKVVDALAELPRIEHRLKELLSMSKDKRLVKIEHDRQDAVSAASVDATKAAEKLDRTTSDRSIETQAANIVAQRELAEAGKEAKEQPRDFHGARSDRLTVTKALGIDSLLEADSVNLTLTADGKKALVTFTNGRDDASLPADIYISAQRFYSLRKKVGLKRAQAQAMRIAL